MIEIFSDRKLTDESKHFFLSLNQQQKSSSWAKLLKGIFESGITWWWEWIFFPPLSSLSSSFSFVLKVTWRACCVVKKATKLIVIRVSSPINFQHKNYSVLSENRFSKKKSSNWTWNRIWEKKNTRITRIVEFLKKNLNCADMEWFFSNSHFEMLLSLYIIFGCSNFIMITYLSSVIWNVFSFEA